MPFPRSSLLTVLVAMILGSGCASTRPVLQSVNARVLRVDTAGVDLAFDVDIKNPLPIPLKSVGGRYGLDVAGKSLASWDKVPALELPAGKVGTVTLPARLEYANLISMLKELATAQEIAYRMDGALVFSMISGDVDVPFAHEGTVPGPAEAIRRRAGGILDR